MAKINDRKWFDTQLELKDKSMRDMAKFMKLDPLDAQGTQRDVILKSAAPVLAIIP
jgi:hypothetical protein